MYYAIFIQLHLRKLFVQGSEMALPDMIQRNINGSPPSKSHTVMIKLGTLSWYMPQLGTNRKIDYLLTFDLLIFDLLDYIISLLKYYRSDSVSVKYFNNLTLVSMHISV